MKRQLWAIGAAWAWLQGGISGAAEPANNPLRVWEELDIVPMPKEIVLTGKQLALDGPDPTVLVTGTNPLRQSVIGAEWINARMAEHGGRPLAVVAAGGIPAGARAIVIGTREDNPLIAAAAAGGVLNIGPGNPGVRGYEIRTAADGGTIFLGGADAIGALYACVTFGELLQPRDGRLGWREASVRDWPDCIHVASGYSILTSEEPEFREDYKSFYDRLLRWKITGLNHRQKSPRGEKFKANPSTEALKTQIDYGKERGIGAILYAEKPYVGLVKNYPEAAQDKSRVLSAPVTASEDVWIRGWEFDDIRRETARNLAEYLKATGFTDVAFHDTDTGGWDNPAQWNSRPEASRKRWGDDYAAATAHIFQTYYEEIKKLNPDVRLHFVFYPYTIWIFDDREGARLLERTLGGSATASVLKQYQERYTAFWKHLHGGFPVGDVNFAIRETTPVAVRNWRALIPGRGAFVWEALMTKWWTPVFSEAAAWTPTFCDNLNDYLFVTYAGNILPLQVLAVREYAWNRNTPGAKPWSLLDTGEQWKHGEPRGEIYSVVLPKLARNVFGRQAAPYLVRALSKNVEPDQALGRARSSGFDLLKTHARLQWQSDNAREAAEALDELWSRCREANSHLGMDDYAFRRFVLLRETMTACRWMSQARADKAQAEELAGAGQIDKARQAIAAGIVAAEAGQTAARQLVAERPADVGGKAFGARRVIDTIDFQSVIADLQTFSSNIESYAESAQVFNPILDALAKGRVVKGLKLESGTSIAVDGRLDEAAWQRAWPIENFTVIGHGRKMAQAVTRARVLIDGEFIYAGVESRVPQGLRVLDKDTVDFFVANADGMGSDYAQVSLSANGFVVPQYNQKTAMDPPWNGPRVGDGSWPVATAVHRESDRWSAEFKVPLGPMLHPGKQFGAWRLNLSRNCYFEKGPTEISGILPFEAANKHDVSLYPAVAFTLEPAPPIHIVLSVEGLKLETVTLPDRIATVATFSAGVEANGMLNDVALSAEAYGPDGKLQRSAKLAEHAVLFHRLPPGNLCRVEFSEVVTRGGVLLKLEAAEGRTEFWIRFGGWEGTDAE